jgi:heavy metal translocating P-type ATPase
MFPVIGVVLAGFGIITFARANRQPTLLERISEPAASPSSQAQPPSEKNQPKGLLAPVSACFEQWDGQYQSLVQTRIDPLLMGRLRAQQMESLAHGHLRELSRMEKQANRSLALGVIAAGLAGLAELTAWPLIPAVVAIGVYTCWPGIEEAWRVAAEERRFSLLHLTQAYFLWPWFGGYYLAGTVGIIFGNLCGKFQLLTQTVTRYSLTHLLGEQPAKVWVVLDGAEIEIPFERLQLGDILVLSAGQPVPVDGVVVQGTATVDQHRLTGESQPVEKSEGDAVLAATLVLGGRIRVRVEKTGAETAAARIGDVLNRTVESQEIRIADQFRSVENTRWPMVAGAVLGWLVGGPKKAVGMLGCNFLLAQIPLRFFTLLNGLGAGAERGVLVKDGRALERLPTVDTVLFDKTGTLTLDQQQVVRIHCCEGHAEEDLLAFAAAAEQRQAHPIAQAILAAAAERQLELPVLDEARYELGYGLEARIRGKRVRVGSERFLALENLGLPDGLRQAQSDAHAMGHALVFVAVGEAVAGAIELAATLRPEAKATVEWLRRQGLALYILSGDQDAPTRALATELGMSGYFANTLPEQKAERVRELQARGKRVCFIGDGINDAIALRQAEVSISLRGATTVATDAAQVVLMEDHLDQLRLLWELAQGFERIVATNARLASGLSVLAFSGVLLLPHEFWFVQALGITQAVTGIAISQRPLLEEQPVTEPTADGATRAAFSRTRDRLFVYAHHRHSPPGGFIGRVGRFAGACAAHTGPKRPVFPPAKSPWLSAADRHRMRKCGGT